jgi:hypothetical protein
VLLLICALDVDISFCVKVKVVDELLGRGC